MMKLLKNKTNLNTLFIMSGYYLGLVVAMYSPDKWTKMGSCLVLFGGSFVDVTRSSSVNIFKVKELRNGLLILLFSFILFASERPLLFTCKVSGDLQKCVIFDCNSCIVFLDS